jgi:transposase InsO family protein
MPELPVNADTTGKSRSSAPMASKSSVATKEKVRVASALDCCDREAIAHVATTDGITSEVVQDLVSRQ